MWVELFRRKLNSGVQFENVIYGQQKMVMSQVASVRVTPMGTADHHIVNLKGEDEMYMALKLNGITGVVSFHDKKIEQSDYLRDLD